MRDRSRAAVLAKNRKFFLPPSHLALLLDVTRFEFMEKLYGSWN